MVMRKVKTVKQVSFNNKLFSLQTNRLLWAENSNWLNYQAISLATLSTKLITCMTFHLCLKDINISKYFFTIFCPYNSYIDFAQIKLDKCAKHRSNNLWPENRDILQPCAKYVAPFFFFDFLFQFFTLPFISFFVHALFFTSVSFISLLFDFS